MWPFNKEQRVLALIEKAQEALDSARHEDALRIADKIIANGHTFGFELKARALAGLDRHAEAVSVLETGVGIAPQVPALWSWLGTCRSDAGDYPGAHAAFARLETCPGGSRGSAFGNDALVFLREGRLDDALARIDEAGTPAQAGLRMFLAGVRISIYGKACRWEDVIRFGELEIEWFRAAEAASGGDGDAMREHLGRLQGDVAEAWWRGRNDAAAALARCFEASTSYRGRRLLALIREIEGHDAGKARPYRLLCAGTALMAVGNDGRKPEPAPHEYATTYWVLAETPDEGLGYARRFEVQEFREGLLAFGLTSAEALTDSVGGCKGVYGARLGRTIVLLPADGN
jgi:tetratricopeptide (TPR) repeat protein